MKTISELALGLDRFLSSLRNRHFLALDVLAFCLTVFVAMWIRLDRMDAVVLYLDDIAIYLLVVIFLRLLVFVPLGIYSAYWRQASIDELAMIGLSVLTSTALIALVFFALLRPLNWIGDDFPRSIPFLDGFLVLIAVGGLRYSVRLAERLQQQLQNHALVGTRVVIFGAGKAGTSIVREMQTHPRLGLVPAVFIDTDPGKRGTRILGVPVVRGDERLENVVKTYRAEQAVISMPTASGKAIRELVNKCEAINLPVKIVPGMSEILDGRVTVSQLRPVDIVDLLRREPIEIDMTQVKTLVQGKRILVTGAGGSIGGELCRQLVQHQPASITLLGHGENSIFYIAHDLQRLHRELPVQRVIADVRDEHRIRNVFECLRPEIVFHAAAHKHVALMEENIEDAITTNILGTRIVLESAVRSQVEHFVLISTDKAVNPTSIMGVTKRVAEMLTHETATRTGRCYVSVRFGNVLGSRGSVVQLFRQQISRGGPVTVTHPQAKRYFMTIPEAVQLVLQAAALGKGGETFVLDMGEQVMILDLARDLIRLSGLQERDIEIAYTGLRPGEKLEEELFLSDEMYNRTAHPKLFATRNGVTADAAFARDLILNQRVEQLIGAARAHEPARITAILQELVPEFHGSVPAPIDTPMITPHA